MAGSFLSAPLPWFVCANFVLRYGRNGMLLADNTCLEADCELGHNLVALPGLPKDQAFSQCLCQGYRTEFVEPTFLLHLSGGVLSTILLFLFCWWCGGCQSGASGAAVPAVTCMENHTCPKGGPVSLASFISFFKANNHTNMMSVFSPIQTPDTRTGLIGLHQ